MSQVGINPAVVEIEVAGSQVPDFANLGVVSDAIAEVHDNWISKDDFPFTMEKFTVEDLIVGLNKGTILNSYHNRGPKKFGPKEYQTMANNENNLLALREQMYWKDARIQEFLASLITGRDQTSMRMIKCYIR